MASRARRVHRLVRDGMQTSAAAARTTKVVCPGMAGGSQLGTFTDCRCALFLCSPSSSNRRRRRPRRRRTRRRRRPRQCRHSFLMPSAANAPSDTPRALPPVPTDDVPSSLHDGDEPLLPPKITLDGFPDAPDTPSGLKDVFLSAPSSPMREALSPPAYSNTPPDSPAMTPVSATLGIPSSSGEGKPKKPNPFVDLLETEKTYVDLLSGIIRVRCSSQTYAYANRSLICSYGVTESRFGVVPIEPSPFRAGLHV